ERVVDREADAHHGDDLQGEGRHVGGVGDDVQDGQAADHREDGHDERQERGRQGAEQYDQQDEQGQRGDQLRADDVVDDLLPELFSYGDAAAGLRGEAGRVEAVLDGVVVLGLLRALAALELHGDERGPAVAGDERLRGLTVERPVGDDLLDVGPGQPGDGGDDARLVAGVVHRHRVAAVQDQDVGVGAAEVGRAELGDERRGRVGVL